MNKLFLRRLRNHLLYSEPEDKERVLYPEKENETFTWQNLTANRTKVSAVSIPQIKLALKSDNESLASVYEVCEFESICHEEKRVE